MIFGTQLTFGQEVFGGPKPGDYVDYWNEFCKGTQPSWGDSKSNIGDEYFTIGKSEEEWLDSKSNIGDEYFALDKDESDWTCIPIDDADIKRC